MPAESTVTKASAAARMPANSSTAADDSVRNIIPARHILTLYSVIRRLSQFCFIILVKTITPQVAFALRGVIMHMNFKLYGKCQDQSTELMPASISSFSAVSLSSTRSTMHAWPIVRERNA